VIQEYARGVNAHLTAGLDRVLLPHRAVMRHPDPARAVGLGYRMLVGALRETLLFSEVWPAVPGIDDADLTDELSRMYLGYLGVSPA
jgi:hypothetical protein